jgi:hypothetical protein
MTAASAVADAMADMAVRGGIVGRMLVRDLRHFLRERQQGITFGAAHPSAGVLTEEENDERKNKTKTDDESEWDDRHGRGPRDDRGWLVC